MGYKRKCQITWLPGDVQTLRPEWSHEKCEEWLCENAKHIEDRSVEVGWEIIEALLPAEGEEPEQQEQQEQQEPETIPCSKCGTPTPVDLIDAKDDGTGNFTILECRACYGPGWCPAVVEANGE